LSFVELAYLSFVPEPDVALTIAKDSPDDVVAEALSDGPVFYVVVAQPAAETMSAATQPERAVLIAEDGADVGEIEAVGAVEELPPIAAPTGCAARGLGKDAPASIFGDGKDTGSAEGSEGVRSYAAVNKVAARWKESADVLAVSYPQGVVVVAKNDSPGFGGDSLLFAQHFDLTSVRMA
jgi:hypothetical protein